MNVDYYRLLDAISEYGKAMYANGESGGTMGEGICNTLPGSSGEITWIKQQNITPEYTKACECWGKVLDELDRSFKMKGLFRRLFGL